MQAVIYGVTEDDDDACDNIDNISRRIIYIANAADDILLASYFRTF